MAVLNRLARPNDLGFKDIMEFLTGVIEENKDLKAELLRTKDREPPMEIEKERGK